MYRITFEIDEDKFTKELMKSMQVLETAPGGSFRFAEVRDYNSRKVYTVTIPRAKVGEVVKELGPRSIKGQLVQEVSQHLAGLTFDQIAKVVGGSELSIRNAIKDLRQAEIMQSVDASAEPQSALDI